jgi:uncharacterized membrane protein
VGKLEAWIASNSDWIAIAIVVAAFVVRVAYASSCYLNPDESLHFNAARPNTWADAYRASFALAHPPLFILVLHAFLFLGRTELILRMPSLLAGTAALWLAFAWMRRIVGSESALAGLLFLAISPAAISAATEARQYGLLLFFICAALYATERALAERSTRWAIAQGLFLICALLTHYIAVIAIFSIALYIAAQCILDHVPRRLVIHFFATQAVLTSIVVWLYLSRVRRSMAFETTSVSYLDRFFYRRGTETIFGFSRRACIGTFSYLMGHKLALPLLIVLLAGAAAFLFGRATAKRSTAFLVLGPFAAGFVAAIVHVFPFAGSRHQTYLLPFLAAGIAAAVTWLPRGLTVSSLLAGAAAAPFWLAHSSPDNNPRNQPIGDMLAAVDFFHGAIPPAAPLFVDKETRLVLEYYLGRNDPRLDSILVHPSRNEFLEGHQLISSESYGWSFSPADALNQARRSAAVASVPSGQPLWIVSVAWLDPPLASRLPAAQLLEKKVFGAISLIEIPQ